MCKPRIEIASDVEDIASRMVRLFAFTASRAVAARGVFCTALSGGHTPAPFFRRLASDPQGKALPWDKTHVFWVDERYVPSDSQASNYRLAAETFLNHVDIPRANVHRVPTEHGDIRNAAQAYERTICEVFRLRVGGIPQFDLIVLGMGSDGHTASLFPHSPMTYDVGGLVCVAHPGIGAKPPVDRITLTPPVLLAARRLVVLVAGRDKAQTLREVLTGGPNEDRYPIRVLWPALDRVLWLADRDAAAEIVEA